jgi:flagellar basal body L-ring protein FlgH
MKLLLTLLAFVLLAGCASDFSHNHNWQQQAHDEQAAAITQKVRSKSITLADGNRQMIAISKTYFPNDTLLIGLWEDMTAFAEQLERREITAEKYGELRAWRMDLFHDANVQRHNYAQQVEAQQRRAEFMGNFLGAMGRNMQRTNPPPVTCSTTSMPGVLTTNCR